MGRRPAWGPRRSPSIVRGESGATRVGRGVPASPRGRAGGGRLARALGPGTDQDPELTGSTGTQRRGQGVGSGWSHGSSELRVWLAGAMQPCRRSQGEGSADSALSGGLWTPGRASHKETETQRACDLPKLTDVASVGGKICILCPRGPKPHAYLGCILSIQPNPTSCPQAPLLYRAMSCCCFPGTAGQGDLPPVHCFESKASRSPQVQTQHFIHNQASRMGEDWG